MEHKFVTPHDDFVRAIAVCRQRLLDCSAEAVMSTLLDRGVKQNGSVEGGVPQVLNFYLYPHFTHITSQSLLHRFSHYHYHNIATFPLFIEQA